MGRSFRFKNFQPNNPVRTMNSRDGFAVRMLRNSTAAFAKSQTFNTGAPTIITFDGDLCMNPIVRGAADTTQAVLAMPSDLWFTTAAAVAISDGKIEGVDHLGREQVIRFSKTSTQATFTMTTSVVSKYPGDPDYVCWSSIRRITLTNISSNTTIQVGTSYSTGVRLPRIPIPIPVSETDPTLSVNGAHLGNGILVTSAGGGTFTNPAAIPGRTTNANVVLTGQTALFTGTITVNPTSEWEVFVPYRPGYVGSL